MTVTTSNDDKSFSGGIAVHVVNSPEDAITDEPNGHTAPIARTELFMDSAMQMVRFPAGA